jgi:hypothetical protein
MHQDSDPSARSEQPPDSTVTAKRVDIRVPHYWPENLVVLFTQLKIQFALPNIMQDATQF